MSQPFEILDHTADTGFLAWGATAAELFENSARAMMAIAADTSGVESREQMKVEVEGEDYESLMVNWLNEVLYLFDTDAFAAKAFHVDRVSSQRLSARLVGQPRDPRRHPWDLIIKAVTYYELRVGERNGRWESQVFVDI